MEGFAISATVVFYAFFFGFFLFLNIVINYMENKRLKRLLRSFEYDLDTRYEDFYRIVEDLDHKVDGLFLTAESHEDLIREGFKLILSDQRREYYQKENSWNQDEVIVLPATKRRPGRPPRDKSRSE